MTDSTPAEHVYRMRISRLTIDKLGVKLYDRASAVVAELIANSYDADAQQVTVQLPLATQLNLPPDTATNHESGWEIIVEDDGHGMTPEEAQDHYLKVGLDRRVPGGQGATSRKLNRPVMGRKGIGKLAPFGICRQIEVLSAGGEETEHGYLVTHFRMNFDDIVRDEDEDAKLETGIEDHTYREKPGTIVTLRHFLPKRVPDMETFHRQLGRRFRRTESFNIFVEDIRNEPGHAEPLKPFEIPSNADTRVDLDDRPVMFEKVKELPVQGYVAMAKQSYRNEDEVGVRIYARNKLVAHTNDFGIPAGFTGEHTARSYLVGEIHAEWLDEDDGEDLIRTDRQGILWDSEYGKALQEYGIALIRDVANLTREPRRRITRDRFLKVSDIETLARNRFEEAEVIDAVMDLARQIGALAAEDELKDDLYVSELSEIILTVAPHKALMDAFRTFASEVGLPEGQSIDRLADLFGKTRIAEFASYSQIAAERVKVIKELERALDSVEANESDLQGIVASAPWLIRPDWTILTANQTLKTFRDRFESWWKRHKKEKITVAISYENKLPDFTLISADNQLFIVEIKRRGHKFDNSDFDRLHNYVEAFDLFKKENPEYFSEYSKGWCIYLIADSVSISDPKNKRLFGSLRKDGTVVQYTWDEFLLQTSKSHEQFLAVHDSALRKNEDESNLGEKP